MTQQNKHLPDARLLWSDSAPLSYLIPPLVVEGAISVGAGFFQTREKEGSAARISLPQALSSFEECIKAADLKDGTKRVYLSRILQFKRYLEEHYNDTDASLDDPVLIMQTFLWRARNEHKLQDHSLRAFGTLFRHFSEFSGLHYTCQIARSNNVRRRVLSAEDHTKLVIFASQQKSWRDLVLILFFLTTDIRVGECTRLTFGDLVLNHHSGEVRWTRGKKQHVQPIAPALRAALRVWLVEHGSGHDNSEYLFPNGSGGPITVAAVNARLRKLGWRTGLDVCSERLRSSPRYDKVKDVSSICPLDAQSSAEVIV